MRAILIDVSAQALTEIEVPDDDAAQLKALQKAVGGYLEFAVVIENGDVIFVDEEGLLKGPVVKGFAVKGAHQPFAGNGVVVGSDADGNSLPAKVSIETLERLISWPRKLH
jgi:hypothetical protein